MGLILLGISLGLPAEHWPAWVQAVGTFEAVIIAAVIGHVMQERQIVRDAARRDEDTRRFLLLLAEGAHDAAMLTLRIAGMRQAGRGTLDTEQFATSHAERLTAAADALRRMPLERHPTAVTLKIALEAERAIFRAREALDGRWGSSESEFVWQPTQRVLLRCAARLRTAATAADFSTDNPVQEDEVTP